MATNKPFSARQWRLLKLLAFSPNGFTVKELRAVSGVSDKTIRRDLALLKKVGFDVSETVEDFGRKLWRVRRLSESTVRKGQKGEQYLLIHDALPADPRCRPDPWRFASCRESVTATAMGTREVSRTKTKATVDGLPPSSFERPCPKAVFLHEILPIL